MDNSIYIMVSQQMAVFRDMDVTANNIANVNTAGYHAEKLMFSDYLIADQDHENAYANDPISYRDTSVGSFKTTGNPLDMAIRGNAYFQVETPLGPRYTKQGSFQIAADGTIVNTMGYPVLGSDGGQIVIPETAKDVVVNGVGQISADGEEIGQIGVMEFTDEQKMQRTGNNLFNAEEKPQPSETARVVQGAIEMSNVAGVSELTRVMKLSRSVASSAKFIETMYELQRKVSATYAKQQS